MNELCKCLEFDRKKARIGSNFVLALQIFQEFWQLVSIRRWLVSVQVLLWYLTKF